MSVATCIGKKQFWLQDDISLCNSAQPSGFRIVQVNELSVMFNNILQIILKFSKPNITSSHSSSHGAESKTC
jgi:hypothetical protein